MNTGNRILFVVTLKLTVVAFLLEELDMVVLAVELSLMCNVVGWAYSTSSIGAFETALMVWSSINRDLFKRISGFIAPHTFIFGAHKHVRDFVRSSILTMISWFFWFHDLRGSFKTLV